MLKRTRCQSRSSRGSSGRLSAMRGKYVELCQEKTNLPLGAGAVTAPCGHGSEPARLGTTYLGQPILFSSASGRSRASRAAAGRAMPLGTNQISTRRFLAASVSWMAAPRRSRGAVVDIVHDVGKDSDSCVAPTQLPL